MAISKIKGSAINDGAITLAKTDSLFVNTEISGTEGVKMPVGTTAQRANAQAGDQRFNSTLSLMEYYDGSQWKPIDSPPVVSSISPTTESDANANIVITGSNFQSGATVKFVGDNGTQYNSPTVTFTNSTSITAKTPATALSVSNEPYDVVVTNPSGLSGTGSDFLDAGGVPAFTSSAGSLGTIPDAVRTGVNLNAGATDPDGDTITYSISVGSLPAGLSINTSSGVITGTASAVGSDTTSTFTVSAATPSDTSTRQFSITVAAPIASGGTELVYNVGGTNYVSHTFTSNGNFVLNSTKALEIMMIGGGGHGGVWHSGAGGAGAMIEASGSVSAGTYAMVRGAGGTNNGDGVVGNSGSASTGFGMTAYGGGRGGRYNTVEPDRNLTNTGSGAGGNGYDTGSFGTASGAGTNNSLGGYTGNIYVNAGGSANTNHGGGGGGGAGGAGASTGNTDGGAGGAGRTNSWRTGSNEGWAAGGGGGSWQSASTGGPGGEANGQQIGGRGSFNNNSGAPISAVSAATTSGHALPANTGSGGAGDGSQAGTSTWDTQGLMHGADGIIVIRYAV